MSDPETSSSRSHSKPSMGRSDGTTSAHAKVASPSVTTFIPTGAPAEALQDALGEGSQRRSTSNVSDASGRREARGSGLDVAGSFAGRAAGIVDRSLQTWLTPHAARGWKRALRNLFGSGDGLEAIMVSQWEHTRMPLFVIAAVRMREV